MRVPQTTVIDEDREFVEQYFEMPDEEMDVNRMSPWLLRIEVRAPLGVTHCSLCNKRGRGPSWKLLLCIQVCHSTLWAAPDVLRGGTFSSDGLMPFEHSCAVL